MAGEVLSRERLLGKVNTSHGDLCLLAFSFVTGLLDCATFNNWGVFVAMQTGLPTSQPYSYATTLVSLSSFFVGAVFSVHVSRWAGATLRPTIFANFLLQSLLIAVPAALVTAGIIPTSDRPNEPSVSGNPLIIGGLPALAFQSGMQIGTSRLLGLSGELPVNVLTSTYAALAADEDIFKRHNKPRNRRIVAVLLLISGAFCSTWIMKKGPGIVLILWLGAFIKFVVAIVAGLFLQSNTDKDPEEESLI